MARYVGQTSNFKKRWAEHIKGMNCTDGSIRKKMWIQSLLNRGLIPTYLILLELPDSTYLDEAETFWIAEFKSRGCKLTNLTDGGGGLRGYKQSPETVEKRVAHLRGRKQAPEVIEQKRLRQLGIKQSPESIEKRRQSMIGHKVSAETRKKIGDANRGAVFTKEHLENISLALTGKTQTAEQIAKKSASLKEYFKTNPGNMAGKPSPKKGRLMSPEERAKHANHWDTRSFQDQHGNVYKTVKEASEKHGILPGSICNVLAGRRKTTKGLTFTYIDHP
jgi:group I intron endonuclease